MIPQSQPRPKVNSSRVNLLISFIFHATLALVLVYFAARQGLLGKQMKKISIEMVKEPPPPKPKALETPKVEPPRIQEQKAAAAPKPVEEAKAAPAAGAAQPTVAPPAAELPTLDFGGGEAVETSSDPVQLYKGALEYAFRSKWNRPDDMNDSDWAAEVKVSVEPDGEISDVQWEKGSGNQVWDDSVRRALAAVKSMDRLPPTNFPPRVTIRFDVQENDTEPVMQ
jgi:colicin import membrane protein